MTAALPLTAARGAMFATEFGAPHFQIAWDSTSLGLLKECPRKYYYTIICGYKGKGENVHLTFGRLYHAGLEAYDHYACSIGKLDGHLTDDEHRAATVACLRHTFSLAGTRSKPPCVVCHGSGQAPRHGASAAELLLPPEVCENCAGTGKQPDAPAEWHTWQSTDAHKNMWTLSRTLTLYCDTFRNNPMRTVELSNGKPAVELSFAFEVGDVGGINYKLCGHIDRMVHQPEDPALTPVPHDRKTTKNQLNASFWRQFSPHNQFSLYATTCAVHYDKPANGLVVDGAQVTPGMSNFARMFIPFPPQLINEWLGETQFYVEQAARFAEAGFWPRNDKSCSNYGGCAFQRVCSKTEAHRQAWLDADFHYDPWNPLVTRGDI